MDWTGVVKSHIGRFGNSVPEQRRLPFLTLYNICISIWSKVIGEKRRWPKKVPVRSSVTWHITVISSDYIIYVAKWPMWVFPHTLRMGEVTWLTWPQITCMKNPRHTKCEYPRAFYFLKVSSSWERLCVIGGVANYGLAMGKNWQICFLNVVNTPVTESILN